MVKSQNLKIGFYIDDDYKVVKHSIMSLKLKINRMTTNMNIIDNMTKQDFELFRPHSISLIVVNRPFDVLLLPSSLKCLNLSFYRETNDMFTP